MMRMVAAVVVMGVGVAHAESPFAVLMNPKATWTYDVVKGKKHKPTGAKATITVTGVHATGAYTAIEFTADGLDDVPGTWMLGPEGLREILYFKPDENGGYTEDYLKSEYDEHYVPRAYLQPAPAVKKKLHWKLGRFGDEDRDYNVTGSIAKAAHAWRTAWKGHYSIPETGEKTAYTWSTEYDPAVGFTEICDESNVCLRIAR